MSKPVTTLFVLALGAWLFAFPGRAQPAVGVEARGGPVTWPEREREFFMDGPGLLLKPSEREELLAADAGERSAWIDGFLAENHLSEGIAKRRELVFGEFVTFLDDRARVMFLHGPPTERYEVECGQTFQPIEIWTYAETVTSRQLVFYKPRSRFAHRLWLPLDSKKALYTDDMGYWLEQYEELRRFIQGRRFDMRACGDALLVDQATGVSGLRGYRKARPSNDELLALLEPPEDRAAWAREALSTVIETDSPVLQLGGIDLLFPERRAQRVVSRVLLTIPPDVELGLQEEGEGPLRTEKHRLTVQGVVEQDGAVFEDFRMRFRVAPPSERIPIALAVERALRPERQYLLRLQISDEVTGAEKRLALMVSVPKEIEAVEAVPLPDVVIVEMEEELALAGVSGQDSLLLAPPDGRLAIGIWRAEALVSGQRIVEVVFSVDGQPQLRRKEPPFTAEIRLSEFPTEQVIRAQGFDANGDLVAFDEVVLNQPRGSFDVKILQPEEGAAVPGRVEARAEVAIPDDRRVETVDFLLNDELISRLTKGPWRTDIDLALKEAEETTYLTVIATLDNGERAEAVRFLNSPQHSEAVEVNLVEMLVTVLDGSNRPVLGLEREEFEVFEDGRPQEIDRFELVDDLPLSIGITIDTSSSMATALPEAQKAAIGFLGDVMEPKDKAFLVSFAGEPALIMPPTDDLVAVERALSELKSVGWTALHDAIVTSLYYFRGFRGQRALILLSDGDDSASHFAFREALEYASRSGVVIYTVGLGVSPLKAGIRKKLGRLAEETGGRSFYIQQAEELSQVYKTIEEELRSQYFVAYNSDNPAGEGEFRTIELKVRDGRLKSRTLRGYHPG